MQISRDPASHPCDSRLILPLRAGLTRNLNSRRRSAIGASRRSQRMVLICRTGWRVLQWDSAHSFMCRVQASASEVCGNLR